MKQNQNTGQDYKQERRSFRRRLSPLRLRILSVNLLALIAPAIAILYTIDSHEQLTNTALMGLEERGRLVAAALGDAATQEQTALNQSKIQSFADRISVEFKSGVKLFIHTSNGTLLAGPKTSSFVNQVQALSVLKAHAVQVALSGEARTQRVDSSSAQVPSYLIATLPVVTRDRDYPIATVGLLHDASEIDTIISGQRWQILTILLIGLTFTTLISLYLGRTIAHPLRVLSEAADQIRTGLGRGQVEMPQFLSRSDEIADLSRSMNALNRALNERLNAIASFASDVAHEIRNPLASVRSAVELAMRTDDEDKRSRLMTIVLTDAKRLDRLVTDISSMSRLDADLAGRAPECVDLPEMLRNFVSMLEDTGTADCINFELEIPKGEVENLLKVKASEDGMAQLLHNLIGNAISFSPKGGAVRLTLEEFHGKTDDVTEDSFVRLAVMDDGPGILLGKERDIFKRFYTDRPRVSSGDTGHSGLGLSICHQIIETFGGTITAGARPDGKTGAMFEVLLPQFVARG